jgi:hypothetical protein
MANAITRTRRSEDRRLRKLLPTERASRRRDPRMWMVTAGGETEGAIVFPAGSRRRASPTMGPASASAQADRVVTARSRVPYTTDQMHTGKPATHACHMTRPVRSSQRCADRLSTSSISGRAVKLVGVSREANEDDPAAVDEETECWLSQPHILQSLAEADADYAAGRTFSGEEIRTLFGLPPREADRSE